MKYVGAPVSSGQDITSTVRQQAANGDTAAQYSLGGLYFDGLGLPQDYVQAAFWYRKAAEQGEPRAQRDLGVLHGNGQGVPKDYAAAYFWLDLAAAGELYPPLTELAAKRRDDAASHLTPLNSPTNKSECGSG